MSALGTVVPENLKITWPPGPQLCRDRSKYHQRQPEAAVLIDDHRADVWRRSRRHAHRASRCMALICATRQQDRQHGDTRGPGTATAAGLGSVARRSPVASRGSVAPRYVSPGIAQLAATRSGSCTAAISASRVCTAEPTSSHRQGAGAVGSCSPSSRMERRCGAQVTNDQAL